jgi:hypothetical protein
LSDHVVPCKSVLMLRQYRLSRHWGICDSIYDLIRCLSTCRADWGGLLQSRRLTSPPSPLLQGEGCSYSPSLAGKGPGVRSEGVSSDFATARDDWVCFNLGQTQVRIVIASPRISLAPPARVGVRAKQSLTIVVRTSWIPSRLNDHIERLLRPATRASQ